MGEYHHGADIERFEQWWERLERLGTAKKGQGAPKKVTNQELLMKVAMEDYPMSVDQQKDAIRTGANTAATLCGGAPST